MSGSSSVTGKGVRIAFDGGRLTSDAGVLVLADVERRLKVAERLARCLIRFPCDQTGLIGFGHPWKSTLPL
jgi:hypothetical protein